MTCDLCGQEFGDLAPPGTFRHLEPRDCISHLREEADSWKLQFSMTNDALQEAKEAARELYRALKSLASLEAERSLIDHPWLERQSL